MVEMKDICPACTNPDAKAALEAVVREAVDNALAEYEFVHEGDVQRAVLAERERWQEAVTLIERVYYMEDKDADWRAAHMNGIANNVQNGQDLAWYRRLFPRAAIGETSEDE